VRRLQSRLRWISFLCVVSVVDVTAPAQRWIKNPSNGHLYALTPRMSWTAAEALAITWAGHLATVRSRAENDWIYKQFGTAVPGREDGYWIGYSDHQKEGSWVWSSGENSRFQAWAYKQPDNFGSGEDYGHVWGPRSAPGQWNDNKNKPLGPTKLFPGVVERRDVIANVSYFGKGCAATMPVPGISSTRPIAGRSFSIQIRNVRRMTGGVLVFGVSDRMWNGAKLPLAVGFLGMPGCSLLVSWDTEAPIFSGFGTTATWRGTVPDKLFFHGKQFYAQAWVMDARANALGVATSAAVKCEIGR
jgi:Lectin C-type domain